MNDGSRNWDHYPSPSRNNETMVAMFHPLGFFKEKNTNYNTACIPQRGVLHKVNNACDIVIVNLTQNASMSTCVLYNHVPVHVSKECLHVQCTLPAFIMYSRYVWL